MKRREFLNNMVAGAALAGSVPMTCALDNPPASSAAETTLYLIPNTHDVVSGWLTDFQVERNTSLNNYLDHLDRVRDDPNYKFAFSEVPNLLSLIQFAPERLGELKQRIAEGRVELCNACFLESTISLSGGETLVQLMVQGLRWYEQVLKIRPRYAWMIDIVGAHQQLPQFVAGLGLDGVFFTRHNPASKNAFWWVAPDGTRALAICNSPIYVDFPVLFTTEAPLTSAYFEDMAKQIALKKQDSASPHIALSLAGAEDYSTAPRRKQYPTEFLAEWRRRYPSIDIRFSTPSDYVNALQREIQSGETRLEEYRGGTLYSWNAFWVNIPSIKRAHREHEQLLLAAEMLATAGSLKADSTYPSQALADGWILLLMNTDRNVLWGSAGGEPFLSKQAWNVEDRYHALHAMSREAVTKSLQVLTQRGEGLVAFNSLNWRRNDPLEFRVAAGKRLAGRVCEADPESPGTLICQADLGPLGLTSLELEAAEPEHLKEIALPEEIENDYYIARFDPKIGALVSLKVKPLRNELLGGPANVLVAEDAISALKKAPTFGADFLAPRPERKVLARSTDFPPHLRALRGPLSSIVAITSDFYGGARLEQRVRFYHQYPRIDFEVRLDLHAQDVLITADFPLLNDVVERTRGIPYGFESRDPRHPFVPPEYHVTWEEGLMGYTETILPAIRWSAYRQAGPGGLAILDRGLPLREVHGSLVILGLVNAVSSYHKYPNELLNSQGWNVFSYALVPYPGSWQEAAIPKLAYEFNAAVLTRGESAVKQEMPFVTTTPNVIVEAMRRLHNQVEVRLYEWQGKAGEADILLHLPHSGAVRTNLNGAQTEALIEAPTCKIQVRPQEIVTLRFSVDSAVAEPEPLRSWERLVPANKRPYLAKRMTKKGHAGVFK